LERINSCQEILHPETLESARVKMTEKYVAVIVAHHPKVNRYFYTIVVSIQLKIEDF
jgi:hypothetical protein